MKSDKFVISTKICKVCHINLDFLEFKKHSGFKDGRLSTCKACHAKNRRLNRKLNPEKYKKEEKNYKLKFPEKRKAKHERYRIKHADKIKERMANYYSKNADKIKARTKENRIKNLDSVRAYKRAYQKRRRQEDSMFRLIGNIRHRLNEFLKTKGISKKSKISEYLGCDKEFLRKHLESLFVEGMSWDNYGSKWHIDHILPLSVEGITEEEIYKRNHYTNLQPLWADANIRK
jgi:glutamate synthase domain-containing protein 2